MTNDNSNINRELYDDSSYNQPEKVIIEKETIVKSKVPVVLGIVIVLLILVGSFTMLNNDKENDNTPEDETNVTVEEENNTNAETDNPSTIDNTDNETNESPSVNIDVPEEINVDVPENVEIPDINLDTQ